MKGVSDQFLKILDLERRRAARGILVGLLVALLAYEMAELSDAPLVGFDVLAFALLLLLGVGVGVLWARWRANRIAESLRTGWNAWMRMSLSCTRLEDVYQKVRSRDPVGPVRAGVVTALALTANLVLFIALWMEAAFAPRFATVMMVANGLLVGAFLGRQAFHLKWTRDFTRALDEVVQGHAIGVWGER